MYPVKAWDHNRLIKTRMNALVRERQSAFSGVVVDLGCGTAPFRGDILTHAREYIAVAWTKTLHDSAADLVADLNQPLPLSDAMADHVVSFEVIEHLAEPATMLREAARILRNGGQLTLSTPFQWWEHE